MILRVGVSACLAGEPVRFDGTGKRDDFVLDQLGRFAELVTVCPEVELGMGTPRPTVRLTGTAPAPRMVSRGGDDWTDAMNAYAARRAAELDRLELCGFVLRSRSPSCGLERVRVYDANDVPQKLGTGLFTAALARALPWLPLEEEGRLRDPELREDFLDAVFALARWREMAADGITPARMVAFHARAKLQLMAHNPALYRDLGRIVARAGTLTPDRLADLYLPRFMTAMRTRAGRRRHVNVLQHIAGYLKRRVNAASRREVHDTIRDYQQGWLPRSVPLVLLRHHAREQGIDYLTEQTYFQPFPLRLLLA